MKNLRHPFEIPVYVFMVILNIVIAVILGFFAIYELAQTPARALVIASVPLRLSVVALLLVALVTVPTFVIARQLLRASSIASSVLATPEEFPEVEAMKAEAATRLGFGGKRRPEIYVTNGNGVLNAFAASAFGHDFVVVHSELFADTLEKNERALRFIVGHELGHIKLGHTRLWYQLSICYSGIIPLLGPWLSRLRELSCDRHGAAVEPDGADGLVLLTAGRYIYRQVQLPGLLRQAQSNIGFWNKVVQLPLSHPLTLNRIRQLSRLGMIKTSGPPVGEAPPPTTGPRPEVRPT